MYINNNDQFDFFNLFLAIILLLMVAVSLVISVPFILYSKISSLFSNHESEKKLACKVDQ